MTSIGVDESYTELLMSLVINGYSESSLLNTFKNLQLPYSEQELNKIKNDLKSELDLFKQRELPEAVFALLINASYCEIKDGSKVKKAACYIVLGIDMEGKSDDFPGIIETVKALILMLTTSSVLCIFKEIFVNV